MEQKIQQEKIEKVYKQYTTLETRRKRGDLIQFYKALSGLDSIEWLNELSVVERGV